MQTDWHYTVTYYAARFAGFNEVESQIIAFAAEHTDLEGQEKATTVILPGEKRTHTFEPIFTANGPGNVAISGKDKLRQIWSVFHFLPGNYLEYRQGNQIKSNAPWYKPKTGHHLRSFRKDDTPSVLNPEVDVYTLNSNDRVKKHFPLICRPHSDLTVEMINHSRQQYHQHGKVPWTLYLAGVRLHVFADTWAHQDFIGACDVNFNRRINSGNGYNWKAWDNGVWQRTKHGEPCWIPRGKMFTSLEEINTQSYGNGARTGAKYKWLNMTGTKSFFVSNLFAHEFAGESMTWLGHGPVGSWPDYPWAVWSWQPAWSNHMIIRNNPEQYLEALVNMVRALRCIRQNKVFTPVSGWKEIRGEVGNASWLTKYQQALSEIAQWENPAKQRDRDERSKVWVKHFSNINAPDGRKAGEPWGYDKDLLQKERERIATEKGNYHSLSKEIAEIPLKNIIYTNYFAHCHAAKVHYRFIRNSLRAQGMAICDTGSWGHAMVDDLALMEREMKRSGYDLWTQSSKKSVNGRGVEEQSESPDLVKMAQLDAINYIAKAKTSTSRSDVHMALEWLRTDILGAWTAKGISVILTDFMDLKNDTTKAPEVVNMMKIKAVRNKLNELKKHLSKTLKKFNLY